VEVVVFGVVFELAELGAVEGVEVGVFEVVERVETGGRRAFWSN